MENLNQTIKRSPDPPLYTNSLYEREKSLPKVREYDEDDFVTMDLDENRYNVVRNKKGEIVDVYFG